MNFTFDDDTERFVENILKKKENEFEQIKAKKWKAKIDAVAEKAYLDALGSFLKTAYQRQMVSDFATEGKLPYIPKDKKLLSLLEKQADQITSKPPYMFITVNPKLDTPLSLLKKKVEKFVSKVSVKKYYYVYEVRKENEGLHCHMLVEYSIRPYDFKRGAKSTFKNICDVNNPHCLNFKFIEENILPDKIDYMNGKKKDKKLAGVEFSVAYRKANNLLPSYESSPPFPCRATQDTLLIEERSEPPPPREVG